ARAITALTHAAATGCAGSPAAVAQALSAAGLTPAVLSPAGVTGSSVTAAAGVTATPAPSAKLTGAHGSRSLQRSGDVSRSASGTEKAQTGGSFPSAIVSALAGLLLALAMVIVPKLRRHPQAA